MSFVSQKRFENSSLWLEEQIASLNERDPVDSMNDLEFLQKLCSRMGTRFDSPYLDEIINDPTCSKWLQHQLMELKECDINQRLLDCELLLQMSRNAMTKLVEQHKSVARRVSHLSARLEQ